MASQHKAYDGMQVIAHVVKERESYDSLARLYALPKWQGIVVFNTRVHRILASPDPQRLPTGRRILIPRSPQGYDRWSATLGRLIAELEGFEMTEDAQLDALLNQKKAFDTGLNFAADVMTLVASLGIKAAEAAKAAGLASDAAREGDAVVHGLQFSWAATDDCMLGMGSLLDRMNLQIEAARKAVRAAGLEKLFDKLAGPRIALARKILKASVKERSIQHWVGATGKALFEYSEYSKPAKLSEALLLLIAGETIDTTVANQRLATAQAVARHVGTLSARQTAVLAEKATVWGVA